MTYFNTQKPKCRTKFAFDAKMLARLFIIVALCFLFVVLIIFPEICTDSFAKGLVLFSTAVLPALFPFLFITKMLTDFGLAEKLARVMQKPFRFLFGADGKSFYVFLMSICCGYPVGAKIISDLVCEKQITKQEANNILPFCTSSGPLFIIGTVGVGMFGNKTFGLKLFAVHFVSVVVVAFIFCNIRRLFTAKNEQIYFVKTQNRSFNDVLAKNMIDTCLSVLLVGGFISFFYLVIDVLIKFKILMPVTLLLSNIFGAFGIDARIASGISSGIVEMTRGCSELSTIGGRFAGVAASAIIAFGGVSIILQSVAFLSKAKISCVKFLGIKIAQTAVAVCASILTFC